MRSGRVLAGVAIPLLLATAQPVSARATRGIVLVAPSEGELVTGLVNVAATSESAYSVIFEASTDGGSTWAAAGTDDTPDDGFYAVWNSGGHNGPALLRGTALSDGPQESATVKVKVDNRAPRISVEATTSPFSPNGDERKDRTKLKLTSDESALLILKLVNKKGRVVRSWSSKGLRTKLAIDFAGRASGSRLLDGRYRLRGKAVDQVGLPATDSKSLMIDTRAPRVRWRSISPEPLLNDGRVAFRFKSRDRSPKVAVSLQTFGDAGRVATTPRKRISRGYGEITWRPRYRSGHPLMPGGYRSRLVVSDDASNRRTTKLKPWRVHRSVRSRVYRRVESAGRRVALTFDDCVYGDAWKRILNILKRQRAKATFFCNGINVAAHPDLARRTIREGHSIGSHTYDHGYLRGKPVSYSLARMLQDRALWWKIARTTTAPYFRPPYGAYDANTLRAAGLSGHARLMMWDVDPQDWMSSSSVITQRTLRRVRPGSVVLLHVKPNTADALNAILGGLERRRLRAVTLPVLFRAAGYR